MEPLPEKTWNFIEKFLSGNYVCGGGQKWRSGPQLTKKRWIYGLIIKDFEFFTYSPSENLCLKRLCIFLEKCRCTILYGNMEKIFFQTDPVPVLILGSPSQSFEGGGLL